MTNALPFTLALIALFGISCAHQKHAAHQHSHGPQCGHVAVVHDGHTDYLDAGHLHNVHGAHTDDHKLAVNAENPADCTPGHNCPSHVAAHRHGATCGHQSIPHGDHKDFVVEGHLHHSHDGHCDDHGKVQLASK